MVFEFQIYDWIEDHEVDSDDESDDETDSDSDYFRKQKVQKYIIHTFGRTMDGKSVYAKITDFTPYFYINLPQEWKKKDRKNNIKIMEKWLKSKMNRKVWDKYKECLLGIDIIEKKSAVGFTNDKKFYFARLVFNNAYAMKKFRLLFEENFIYIPGLSKMKLRFRTFEANLPPMLRCFHIRKISGCSWVSVDDYELIKNKHNKKTHCNIELKVRWNKIDPIQKEVNAPLRIASFDIECYSHDGQFPQARRKQDKIIQIGTTYTYLGESTPYRQHIVCLSDTDKSDKSYITESYDTELEMIEAWRNEIISSDCDIITGYNIFYFDEKYIYDRCKEHLYEDEDDMKINYLSKLKNRNCRFREMKLASSALGENILQFWDTPGRVHIDLMKDVQKTYKLSSYRLDSVSSNFIRGQINSIEKIDKTHYKLKCLTVEDIFIEDYIHLELVKSFVSDYIGKKYVVKEIDTDNKTLIITSNIDLDEEVNFDEGKIFWSQAKDDVGPKDIFRFFREGPKKRAIVAKYCIKDCRLVNLLVNKLEVVTKNIEMSNVCYVPLSYLFIRGQGIKLFSLCLKDFRAHDYIFPVIKKKVTFRFPIIRNYGEVITNEKTKLFEGLMIRSPYSNNEDEELTFEEGSKKKGYNYEYLIEVHKKSGKKYSPPYRKTNIVRFNKYKVDIIKKDGYEGAIVFDPIPEVQYEALATKDFASLYPSSIIHKNMSHETLVTDEKYDNLTGIKYYNACFRENDGHIEWRRFAQKDNNLGVVPTILSTLLRERKAIKKKMKVEKNPFRYKILDAKQLALKITANSLYGQLGASTSPVCMRDIAACTTSTGREMLIFAKKYDEEVLPWIINGIKNAYDKNKNKKINTILNWELKDRDNEKMQEMIKTFTTESINKITMQPIIRYGDSVIGSTPLLLKEENTNKIIIKCIKDLAEKYDNYHETKESCELNNYLVWTEKGWTKIYRVIRHKLAKEKKLLKVLTHTGCVVVTDDHSLLDLNAKEVSPKDIKIGDKLLHSFPNIIFNNSNKSEIINNFSKNNFIICEGNKESLEIYCILYEKFKNIEIEYLDKNKYKFILNKDKNIFVKDITEWNYKEEYVYDLTTENHHFHAGVGSIIVHNTDSIFSCYSFRDGCKKVNSKESLKVWKDIIEFSEELMKPFIPVEYQYTWESLHQKYYSTLLIKKLQLPNPPEVLPEPEHHATLLSLDERFKQFLKEYMEESYLPWLWTLQDIYNRTFNTDKILSDVIQVKLYNMGISQVEKIRLQPEELTGDIKRNLEEKIKKFVKDILQDYIIQPYWDISKNTKVHKVKIYKGGKKITDKRSLQLTMDIGMISGELVKSRLPFPHDLEYEKTYWPFLILTKKRYVGNKYEFNPDKYKQDCMGIVLKRRDNAPIVKEVCGGIINCLINKRDPDGARDFTKKCLDKMFEGKYDIKYFLTSKTLKLKESYKDWTRIAHIVLAERISIRNPGNKPQAGDRIEYAAIEIDNVTKSTLQGDRIEIPSFIKEHDKKIDYLFYMNNQIMKPSKQFLDLAINNAGKIFEDIRIRCENERLGRTNVLNFCKKVNSTKNKKKKKQKKTNKESLDI